MDGDNSQTISIGEKLKNARLSQGIELEKAAVETKIKKSFLEMLENNAFDSLPNLVTARGFMKVYAQYLRLNIQEFIEQFNLVYPNEATGANSPRNDSKEIKVGLAVDKAHLFPSGLKQMNSQSFKYTKQNKFRNSQKFFGSMGGAVVMVLVALTLSSLYFKSSMDSIKTMPRQQSEMNDLAAKLTPEQLQSMQADNTKVFVNAQASDKCYVTTIIDGRMVFKGIMESGDVKSWEGGQYIKIKSSVPRNLNLFINGFDAGVMSELMTMEEKTYFPGQKIATENTTIKSSDEPSREEKAPIIENKQVKQPSKEEAKPTTEETSQNSILSL